MVLCENAYCGNQVVELEYVEVAARRFCCIACAEDWERQNEALISAASPFIGAEWRPKESPAKQHSGYSPEPSPGNRQ